MKSKVNSQERGFLLFLKHRVRILFFKLEAIKKLENSFKKLEASSNIFLGVHNLDSLLDFLGGLNLKNKL